MIDNREMVKGMKSLLRNRIKLLNNLKVHQTPKTTEIEVYITLSQ